MNGQDGRLQSVGLINRRFTKWSVLKDLEIGPKKFLVIF